MKAQFKKPYVRKSKAPRRARRSAPSQASTVALIKRVVAREEETKFCSEIKQYRVTHNSGITNGDIIYGLPKLLQDEGNGNSWQRLGMKVSPRKHEIDCYASLSDVERSGAIEVFWWVLSHKTQKSMFQLNATGGVDMTTFLKSGDSNTTIGFNGTTDLVSLPVNNAKFTVLKKGSFKLGKNTGQVQDSITVGNQPLYTSISHRWKVILKAPKTLVYEQDLSPVGSRTVFYPSGYAPFMVFGYVHQNQTTPDVLNQDLSVTVRTSLYYDDA